jgi:hypothetical protein
LRQPALQRVDELVTLLHNLILNLENFLAHY